MLQVRPCAKRHTALAACVQPHHNQLYTALAALHSLQRILCIFIRCLVAGRGWPTRFATEHKGIKFTTGVGCGIWGSPRGTGWMCIANALTQCTCHRNKRATGRSNKGNLYLDPSHVLMLSLLMSMRGLLLLQMVLRRLPRPPPIANFIPLWCGGRQCGLPHTVCHRAPGYKIQFHHIAGAGGAFATPTTTMAAKK